MDIQVNTEITLPRSNLDGSPIPPATQKWITLLPFISQKILLNIKDVELDFRIGCILVFFPFLWILNVVQISDFWIFDFFLFSKLPILAYFEPKIHIYHWNFSKTTFTYKIMDEITLTHTGWAWKVQNLFFLTFLGAQKFIAYTNIQIHVMHSIFIINWFFLNACKNVLYQYQ